jgi:hypothetical protein
MFAKPLSLIAAALFCVGSALAQQSATPDSPDSDASGPKAGAPSKTPGTNASSMKHDKAMKADKAGKAMDDAASQPTAKKPAKAGAQSGAASSQ